MSVHRTRWAQRDNPHGRTQLPRTVVMHRHRNTQQLHSAALKYTGMRRHVRRTREGAASHIAMHTVAGMLARAHIVYTYVGATVVARWRGANARVRAIRHCALNCTGARGDMRSSTEPPRLMHTQLGAQAHAPRQSRMLSQAQTCTAALARSRVRTHTDMNARVC